MNKLLQLFKQNQARTPAPVRAAAEADRLYVYDVIGGDWYGGVSAIDFIADLKAIEADTVHLHINSPGGDVFEARAMCQAIKSSGKKVIAHVDGLAASAASYLALAADEVEIAEGAFFMIHNAWTLAYGNRHDMRQSADVLEKIDGSIAADYVAKTGADLDKVRAWMDAETWFTADESVAEGFADRKAEGKSTKASNSAWNLNAYEHAPAALTAPATPEPAPEPTIDRVALERRVALLQRIAP